MSTRSRPVRKTAGKRTSDPNFVSSMSAIQDPLGDLVDENREMQTSISRQKGRKRKRARSPSPPLMPFSPTNIITEADFTSMETTPAPEHEPEYEPIMLQFNIQAGFSGPLKVELDPSMLMQNARKRVAIASQSRPLSRVPQRLRLLEPGTGMPSPTCSTPSIASSSEPKSTAYRKWVRRYKTPPRSFMDLPAELRNSIYRMVLVSTETIDFGNPHNCAHSSALLRTCRQIHSEATSILYAENRFVFRRTRHSRSPFWVPDNKEVGYLDFRHFLLMIGSTGRQYLRRLHVHMEDAGKSHATLSDARFTHDSNLIAAFKMIAKDCFLKTLAVTFMGRRHVTSLDVRFLEHLCAIEVDKLVFNPNQHWTGDKLDFRVKEILTKEMVRPELLYEKDPDPSKDKPRTTYVPRPLPW